MAAEQATICKGCWEQMKVPIPLRGPLSAPFRAFGIRPSRMNPNLCTICELSFTKVMRARKIMIDATILFADLRGYTALSQSLNPTRYPACWTCSMTSAPAPYGKRTASSTRRLATR